MLIKALHQEKGSRKLLAEFPNKVFELIPTVFAFLVLVLKDNVHFTAFCLEGPFFPGHGVLSVSVLTDLLF